LENHGKPLTKTITIIIINEEATQMSLNPRSSPFNLLLQNGLGPRPMVCRARLTTAVGGGPAPTATEDDAFDFFTKLNYRRNFPTNKNNDFNIEIMY
jgi:hypothetical protein